MSQEKVYKLYGWQEEAIEYFMRNKQCLFEVATGVGKTFLTTQILSELKKYYSNLKVLIVAPKNVIIEKTWYPELMSNGFTLKDVGIYNGFAKEYAPITITTNQSVGNISLDMFDMIIFDEVHNCMTPRMMDIVNLDWRYKIGLSATIGTDDRYWKLLESFDFKIFKYGTKEALRDEVLNEFDFYNYKLKLDGETRYKYMELQEEIIPLLQQFDNNMSKVMNSPSNNYVKKRLLQLLYKRARLVHDYWLKFETVANIVRERKDDKIIVFNQYNDTTNNLYWRLVEDGNNVRLVHSNLDDTQRRKVIEDFANDKFNVLLTTRMLDEGYNLPKIDTAIIMAGDSTEKQTVQRMGRVLRKKDKRSKLYQISTIGTFEERQTDVKSKYFKDLCNNYYEAIIDEMGARTD